MHPVAVWVLLNWNKAGEEYLKLPFKSFLEIGKWKMVCWQTVVRVFFFLSILSLLQHLVSQTMKFCFLLLKRIWELLVLHLNASNRFNVLQTTFNHPCGVRLEASPGFNNQPFIIHDQCVTTGYLSVIILITAWQNVFTFGHTLPQTDWFLCYCCKNLKVMWECLLASVTNLLDSFSNKVMCSLMFLFFWLGFGPFLFKTAGDPVLTALHMFLFFLLYSN